MFQSTAGFISYEVESFLHTQWFIIANWKWLSLISGAFALYFLNHFLRLALRQLKMTLHRQETEKTFYRFFLEQNLERGLSWIIATLAALVLIENLDLPVNFEKYLSILLRLTISLHVLRLAYFAAEASGHLIQNWAKKSSSKLDDQIAPLATKALKIFVIITGSLVILQNFGVNVTALLAGLGLGGVAIAFAAQDTVANVFGTLTILLDAPFKIGDRIRMGDIEGTVEEVGFRSTRLRTLNNTVVIIANSFVAKEKIENIQLKNGLCRFRQVLNFTYNAKPEQLQLFCQQAQAAFQQDTSLQNDKTSITISNLGESAIQITVVLHFQTSEGQTESQKTERYLLFLQKLAEQNQLTFAVV